MYRTHTTNQLLVRIYRVMEYLLFYMIQHHRLWAGS